MGVEQYFLVLFVDFGRLYGKGFADVLLVEQEDYGKLGWG